MSIRLRNQKVVPAVNIINVGSTSVTPSIYAQTITPENGVDCFNQVTIAAVTSDIDSNIKPSNIKKNVTILGVTGSLDTNQYVIPKTVSGNGTLQNISSLAFSIPSNVVDIGDYCLFYLFNDVGTNSNTITSADFSSLTSISGINALSYFAKKSSITTVDFSNLVSVTGANALQNAFSESALQSLSFPNLETVDGNYAFYGIAFTSSVRSAQFPKLKSVKGYNAFSALLNQCVSCSTLDISKLESIEGYQCFSMAFATTKIKSIDFASLKSINGSQAMYNMLYQNHNATIYFRALETVTPNNAFNRMCPGRGTTVHFPSNLQSVIGSWSDVTNGFGGTNTTVLFDLPATT